MLACAALLAVAPARALADEQLPEVTTPNAPSKPMPPENHAAEAEALFQRGVGLMKADNCADAIPEFLKSAALERSAATLLNLGTCYARLGRKATAWKRFREAATTAQDEQDDAVRERALQAMNILAPTLTKVQIVTPPSAAPFLIRVNGEVIHDYDGLPLPLDSGESVIEAASPGHEPWRRSVQANDLGATIVIQVPELQPLPPTPPRPESQAPYEPPRRDLRVPAIVVGGSGVAAIVVGSVFGISAKKTYDDSKQYCQSDHCTSAGVDLRDSATTKATVSTLSIGIGVVAVATSVVLWLASPTSSPQRAGSPFQQARINVGGFEMQIEAAR